MEGGVWRTISGRKVFIKEGQSLSDAMKESGKFKKDENEDTDSKKKIGEEKARQIEEILKVHSQLVQLNRSGAEDVDGIRDKFKKLNDEFSKGYTTDTENFIQPWMVISEAYDSFYKNNPEIFYEIASWKEISKSPYSDSFYNSINIGWSHKPEGSLRIADHWNFKTKRDKKTVHCKIKGATGKDGTVNGLMLGRYENGAYVMIEEW